MERATGWPRRQRISNSQDAKRAVATYRMSAGWMHTPEIRLAALLAPWFHRGWCLAALYQASEFRPDHERQHSGDPDRNPLGSLEIRLRHWRDEDGRPIDPPITALSGDEVRELRKQRPITVAVVDEEPVAARPVDETVHKAAASAATKPADDVATKPADDVTPTPADDVTPKPADDVETKAESVTAQQKSPAITADAPASPPAKKSASAPKARPADKPAADSAPAKRAPAKTRSTTSKKTTARKSPARRKKSDEAKKTFQSALSEMDELIGHPLPGMRLSEPDHLFTNHFEQQRKTVQDSGYEPYLAELVAQVRKGGPQSLTPEQRSVLRARWRVIRGRQAMSALDEDTRPN